MLARLTGFKFLAMLLIYPEKSAYKTTVYQLRLVQNLLFKKSGLLICIQIQPKQTNKLHLLAKNQLKMWFYKRCFH